MKYFIGFLLGFCVIFINGHPKKSTREQIIHATDRLKADDGWKALRLALRMSHERLVNELIKIGRNAPSVDVDDMDIFVAVRSGNEVVVKALLYNGTDVNLQNQHDKTALHIATERGFNKIVELLLQNGADAHLVDDEWDTPLDNAVLAGNEKLVEIMLANGVDVNGGFETTGKTPLMYAAQKGHEKVVDILVRHGANVNVKSSVTDETPLYLAALDGRVDAVDVLIKYGADINAMNWYDNTTALMAAAEKGFQKTVEMLIVNGADINARSEFGTALHLAIQKEHTEIVGILLNSGASWEIADENGQKPCDYPVFKKMLESLSRQRKLRSKKTCSMKE